MSRPYSWSNWSTNTTAPPGLPHRPVTHSFQPVTITNGGSSVRACSHCSWKFGPRSTAPGGAVHRPLVETPPARVARAHVGHLAVADTAVLRHRDVDLLGLPGIGRVAVDLGIGGFPVPRVRCVNLSARPVGAAEGEE